ncbi:4548_t:CDS:2, partial [Racocetra persica]
MEKEELNNDKGTLEYTRLYDPMDGIGELRSSGIAHVNSISVTEKNRILELFKKKTQESSDDKNDLRTILRIERSVIGYNTSIDDIEMLDSQENFDSTNVSSLNPHEVIWSRLCNTRLVDDAMLHLYLKGRFIMKGQENYQNKFGILNCNNEDQFRPSCENDDELILKWQKIIASRKKTEQVDNSEEN